MGNAALYIFDSNSIYGQFVPYYNKQFPIPDGALSKILKSYCPLHL